MYASITPTLFFDTGSLTDPGDQTPVLRLHSKYLPISLP